MGYVYSDYSSSSNSDTTTVQDYYNISGQLSFEIFY